MSFVHLISPVPFIKTSRLLVHMSIRSVSRILCPSYASFPIWPKTQTDCQFEKIKAAGNIHLQSFEAIMLAASQ